METILKGVLSKGFLEFSALIPNSPFNFEHEALLKAAEDSQIHTFGWPIGLVMQTPEYRPSPYADGIKAKILAKPIQGVDRDETYDYWNLRRNGDYYFIKSLFEDERAEKKLFLDTRIVRVTETLMHQAFLFRHLGIPTSQAVNLRLVHSGLRGRVLSVASRRRMLSSSYLCRDEDSAQIDLSVSGKDLDEKLPDLVFKVISDLTVLFNFFKPGREMIDAMVAAFKQGKIE